MPPRTTKADLFEAAKEGDISTFERYFTQDKQLESALRIEALITEDALADRGTRNGHLPGDVWACSDDRDDHIFQQAIAHGQYDLIEWLFCSSISQRIPRTLQFFLELATIAALHCSEIFILEMLLSTQAWITYPEQARLQILSSLLHTAVINSKANFVAVLTAHGADVTSRNSFDETLISSYATSDGCHFMLDTLRNHGAAVVGDATALHRAIEFDCPSNISWLLELGADPRATDDRLDTPLHKAAHQGDAKAVAVLSHCVDIDARNELGESALGLAVHASSWHRDVDPEEDRYQSSLPDYAEVIRMLLQLGANTDAYSIQEGLRYAPLHWAVLFGPSALVKLLLECGVNPNVGTGDGNETPAHLLASTCNDRFPLDPIKLEKMELLVQHGADLHLRNADGVTAFEKFAKILNGTEWLQQKIDQGLMARGTHQTT